MSENSSQYQKAVEGLSAVVDAAPASVWAAASPCEGWTAAHLMGHLILGTKMISVVETGEGPDHAADLLAVAGDDPAGAYAVARDLALSALTAENLGKIIPTPMGEMPLDQMIGMFMTGDALIHTWDLASAAGKDVTLDPVLCDQTYNKLLPVDGMIRSPGLFGPKIEPPAGASIQTQLLCFTGRKDF